MDDIAFRFSSTVLPVKKELSHWDTAVVFLRGRSVNGFLLKISPLKTGQKRLTVLVHHASQTSNHSSDPLQIVVVVRCMKLDVVVSVATQRGNIPFNQWAAFLLK